MTGREIKFRYGFMCRQCGYVHVEYLSLDDIECRFVPIYSHPHEDGVAYTCDRFRDEFTGLTDKNDKEIYERDIIDCSGLYSPSEVKWYNEECAFIIYLGAGDYMMLNEFDVVEVVGNIHENPELLQDVE